MNLPSHQYIPITPQQFETAYQWLCKQRKHYSPNADIWFFRRDWESNKDQLLQCVCSGEYVFSPLKRIYKQDGQVINLWCANHLKDYQFVCKTDALHYYETIDQYLLIGQIHPQIDNKILRRYLYQVVHRTVEYGGNYQGINHGISRGCPISPILRALYLKALDDAFSNKSNVYYVRYIWTIY